MLRSLEAITPIVRSPTEIKVSKFNLFLSFFSCSPRLSVARSETESILSKSSHDKECIQDEISLEAGRGLGWVQPSELVRVHILLNRTGNLDRERGPEDLGGISVVFTNDILKAEGFEWHAAAAGGRRPREWWLLRRRNLQSLRCSLFSLAQCSEQSVPAKQQPETEYWELGSTPSVGSQRWCDFLVVLQRWNGMFS